MEDQMEKQATVSVDGRDILIDCKPTGRQLRMAARPESASQVLLIQYTGRGTRSIGLDEEIDLRGAGVEEFRTAIGDRLFGGTLNERGFVWIDSCINESDLRRIGELPDDHEIIFDGETDQVVKRGEAVTLEGSGAEQFRSRLMLNGPFCIIVNGRRREVDGPKLTFEQVLAVAFDKAPAPDQTISMTYRNGPRGQEQGILKPCQCVEIKAGMSFNATSTRQS